ncbi:undecaprenyl-phosphate glucose phosphotransferase [Telluribacter sp.]|jgi:putative colanic acid biosynthesis UDP-glucose lipid carrier transferase|uniref:undecaprenyl-phosphate glucose phosphotransferase n=1 Tax=Telluribacter sp. TaxID=1978767 RepID=UPI002E15E6E8|nr:undecaprenyl-phosphate glucose phosphotransferase [Telluribacter sp.]
MDNSYKRFLQIFFILIDLIGLNIGYIIAQSLFKENEISAQYFRYFQYWGIANWFWIILSLLGGMYFTSAITNFKRFLKKTTWTAFVFLLLVLFYLYIPRLIPLSSSLVYYSLLFFFSILIFNRFLYIVIKEWVKREVHSKRRILILGYNSVSRKLASYIEREEFNVKILGYVDDRTVEKDFADYPVYNNLSDTLRISEELKINEIYSTIMPENNAKVYKIMDQADLSLIRFRVVPDFRNLIDRPVQLDQLNDLPILTLRNEPLQSVVNQFTKRAFDIAFSLFVLIFILSWLVPLLGILIYLESPGPIFFSQLRSGKDNKPFWCYKFRSMRINKETEAVQATKNDSRVTRTGKFIRRTSLDEFPQFLNVLKGEMSIVGPRPHMLKHNEDFQALEEHYMIRHYLKPGITGWAQVNGYRGEITELKHIKKRVEYDLWYLEHWSITLDLYIIFLTVYNVFKGEKNAY